MNITNNFTIHLDDWRILPKLHGVQGDANTRSVKLTLMEGGEAWKIPDDVVASVGYRHENGGSGWYDTLPDGTAACTISGNTVTAVLAPGVFATQGRVSLTVILQETDTLDQIATFPLELKVAANPTAEKLENSYYNYPTMESLNAVATVTGEVYFNGEYHFLQDCTFGELLAAYKGGACVLLHFSNTYAEFSSLYVLSYVPKEENFLVFRGEQGHTAAELTVYEDDTVTFSNVKSVPVARTVNGKALSSDITLTAEDVGALPADTVLPSGGGFNVYVGADAPTDPASNVWVDTDEEGEESAAVDPEAVAQAVEDYFAENPVEVPEVVLPEKLPNPYPLNIGGVDYDGSKPVNVEMPSGGGGTSWKLVGEITTTEEVSTIEITSDTVLDEMLVYAYIPPIPEDTGGTTYIRPILKNARAINTYTSVTKPNTKLHQEVWYFSRGFCVRQHKDNSSSAPFAVVGLSDSVFTKIQDDYEKGGGLIGFQIYWNSNCTFPAGVILKVWGR